MVKISDLGAKDAFGLDDIPALVYFENGIPELYEGDLRNDQGRDSIQSSYDSYHDAQSAAVLREAWATLPESSSRPLAATLAQSRNLAHASLVTAVMSSQVSK